MQILPINKQSKTINSSFEAVNQKYLKRAIKEYRQINDVTGDLLDCLYYDVFFKQISPQDGIDTIEAIKKLTKKTDSFTEHVLELLTQMKKLSNQ